MKLAKSTTQVTQNFTPKASYDMKLSDKASAHIIQSLINLYSDSSAAVIRELSSNARDAHVQAGKADVPIKVLTPNRFGNTELVIIDEGVGLDEAGLETYVTLGESTKGDDNSQIGAYGLGCKSPLSMTSQFTVVATKDGIQRHAVIGEMSSGTLGMEILSIRETEDADGVTVRVPVRDEDIPSITAKAEQFFKFWTPGTVLLNGVQPKNYLDELNESQYVKTVNATVYVADNRYSNNNITVIMGNVAYSVDSAQIADKIEGNRYNVLTSLGFSYRAGIVLEAPIGDLELVPSRDSLKYSSLTVNTIVELLKEARDEAFEILAEKVKSAVSYAEAETAILKNRQLVDSAHVVTEYKGQQYNPALKGVVVSGYEDALQDLEESEEYQNAETYVQRERKQELINAHKNAWKISEAVLSSSSTMSFSPLSYSYSRGTNSERLNASANVENAVQIDVPNDSLFGKSSDRVLVHFDIPHAEVDDFRMTAHRAKLKTWMLNKDYRNVKVIAGPVTQNPWVHENDSITIVDGDTFLEEVEQIKAEQKAQRKANGTTSSAQRGPRTEARYEYSEGGYAVADVTISEMTADVLIYKNEELGNSAESFTRLLSLQNAALVGVTRNRSVDAFIRRAENAGKTVRKYDDWIAEVVQKIVSNDGLFDFAVEKVLAANIRNSSDHITYLAQTVELDSEHMNIKVGNFTLGELRGIMEDEVEPHFDNEEEEALAGQIVNMRWMLRHSNEFNTFMTKANAEAANRLGLESVEEDYPMLSMVPAYRIETDKVCDYISMVNASKKA